MSPRASRALVLELSLALRDHVLPLLGSHAARGHAAETAHGGDVTFAIDEQAEQFLEQWLARQAPGLAFFSEDRGLVEPSGAAPEILVVDPIDGTRPALAGLESACVSVAAAPLRDGVAMADVTVGCVVEIKSGATFVAERGTGVELRDQAGQLLQPTLSANTDISRLFWTYGFRGRPARATTEVIGDLIDASSVGGGTFDLGSAAFDMTRILTGQLDAYVEPGPRMIEEVPPVRAEFLRVGGGAVLNNSPYDLAAACLLLEEGGAVVTDAAGRTLADRPLLGSGHDYQMSLVAAANRELHTRLIEAVDQGIARLRSVMLSDPAGHERGSPAS